MSRVPAVPTESHRPTTLLVVDDHGLVRDGVSGMLAREKDFRVVGVASNADEAISKVLETHPDIVLMDIDMPGLSCFDAIQIIRSRAPETKFILVTAYEHDEHLEQALRVKVNGFVMKDEGIAGLADAVRGVSAGRVHFSPDVMSRLVVQGNEIRLENPPKSRLRMLSPRERELLRQPSWESATRRRTNRRPLSWPSSTSTIAWSWRATRFARDSWNRRSPESGVRGVSAVRDLKALPFRLRTFHSGLLLSLVQNLSNQPRQGAGREGLG
jgi:DNA-binding NarL/FixJ family response regulator